MSLSRFWLRRLVQSFGLAVLLLFNSYSDLLNPSHLIMYHAFQSTANVALPPLILLALFTLAGYLLLQVTFGTMYWIWTGVLFACGAGYALFNVRHLAISSVGSVQASFHSSPVLVGVYYWTERLLPLIVLVVVFVVWRYGGRMSTGIRVAQIALNVLLTGAAVFGLMNLWQICSYAIYRPHRLAPLAEYHPTENTAPRVVWVIFDELSYSQLYESRWPGLELPNFDALRQESSVYTHVTPVGEETEKVLPSLLNGVKLDNLVYRDGRAMDERAGTHTLQVMTTDTSIFGVAQQNGWNAAVSGWFNPYCRLYSSVLQQCFVSAMSMWTNKMELGASTLENTELELRSVGGNFVSRQEVGLHHRDAELLVAEAQKLIADPRNDLIFVHLPEPHAPSPYDRRTRTFTDRAGLSYADGLAYADILLGQLMQTLKQSPRWQQTTLVINGDHGWRISLWDVTPAWTAEDQRMSRGHESDLRPAIIVHSPGQTSGQLVDAVTPLMVTHDMVKDIIQQHPKGQSPSAAPQAATTP